MPDAFGKELKTGDTTMLFLASKILDYDTADEIRFLLLEKLREREWTPLIRSVRLNCYEQALSAAGQVGEMEQAIAMFARIEDRAPYIRGDLFLLDDHLFSLVFGDSDSLFTGIRAGIIYEPYLAEPLRRLDAFCQIVSDCLIEAVNEITGSTEGKDRNNHPLKADLSVLSLDKIRIRSTRLFERKLHASAYAPPSCLRTIMRELFCVAPGRLLPKAMPPDCWLRAQASLRPSH
jgi:hypothetical protein